MGIFERLELNVFQRLEEGLPLPDEMTLGEIARLWATTTDKSKNYDIGQAIRLRIKVMCEAFKSGSLKGVDVAAREEAEIAADENRGPLGLIPFDESNRLRIMRESNGHIRIRKSDFIAWIDSENTPLPTNCQLEKWGLDDVPIGADKLAVKKKEIGDELIDKADVQDIGRQYMKKYEGHPAALNCRWIKKLADLDQYYIKYSGHDPVKPDMWLQEIGLDKGKPGGEQKAEKAWKPSLP